MITIKEIIILASSGHLKNVQFMPHETGLNYIFVDENGIASFDQPGKFNYKKLSDISESELERIDEENGYFLMSSKKEEPNETN